MIWLLDTNILIYFANRQPGFERIARRLSGRSPGEARMSSITLSELEYGVENSRARDQNRAALDDLTALVQVDSYPQQAARHYAEIKAALRSKGRPTKPYDLLIGAHARALDATLVTNDMDDFRHMPGVRLVNWLQQRAAR
ncbi:MAG: type II toxin-antitoxin system VapC family toxin [Polyangiaceae bacterium]|nr:type II toxin-antitoxin system VapC family toxin [Polyangiaceae bacterium]MCL4755418.1 type II toxin-antitoxin system VapC family toxin [Myxococcales bacterium]